MPDLKANSNPGDARKSALLVIDVQQEMFEKSIPVLHAEQMLANINALALKARQAGAVVVYIQHDAEKSLVKDTPGWQLHPALAPQPGDERVFKQKGNSFEGTNQTALLAAREVGQVVACGMVTHGCVKNTCLGGLALGYQVVLAGDAHSSYSNDAAEKISEWNKTLADEGVLVQNSAEIRF